MPTTYSKVIPATAGYATTLGLLPAATVAKLEPDLPTVSTDLVKEIAYIYNDGSASDPFVIRVRKEYNPKTDTTFNSIALATAIRKTVSETGDVIDVPVNMKFQWNVGGKFLPDVTLTLDLAAVLCGLVLNVNAAENPTSDIIASFDRGALNSLW